MTRWPGNDNDRAFREQGHISPVLERLCKCVYCGSGWGDAVSPVWQLRVMERDDRNKKRGIFMGQLSAGICSIIGDRKSQQDAGTVEQKEDGTLLAVMCDGMGGTQDGGRASKLAVERMRQAFYQSPPSSENEVSEWLKTRFIQADQEIWSMTDSAGNSIASGSTVTAVYILENNFFWGSVGDSRIYYFSAAGRSDRTGRNDYEEYEIPRAYQSQIITRSHNYALQLDALYRNGRISQKELDSEKSKGRALISYLGIGGLPIVDVAPLPRVMQPDDIVLLCSDGLYRVLEERQIMAIIAESGGDMKLAVNRLCYTARRLGRGRLDNTTAVAVRYIA